MAALAALMLGMRPVRQLGEGRVGQRKRQRSYRRTRRQASRAHESPDGLLSRGTDCLLDSEHLAGSRPEKLCCAAVACRSGQNARQAVAELSTKSA